MAKFKRTLGILDGGGWGVGGVTTVCGRDCIAVACYVQQWILEHNAQSRNQTTADNRQHQQISKVLQFNSSLNKQVLDVVVGEQTSLVSNTR